MFQRNFFNIVSSLNCGWHEVICWQHCFKVERTLKKAEKEQRRCFNLVNIWLNEQRQVQMLNQRWNNIAITTSHLLWKQSHYFNQYRLIFNGIFSTLKQCRNVVSSFFLFSLFQYCYNIVNISTPFPPHFKKSIFIRGLPFNLQGGVVFLHQIIYLFPLRDKSKQNFPHFVQSFYFFGTFCTCKYGSDFNLIFFTSHQENLFFLLKSK